MQEAAKVTFSSPPCFFLLPFYLLPSTSQGPCWSPHCGPAYTLLWFCFKHGPSRLFKLTKSQGAPGFLRLCFTHTHFPCCTQEVSCCGAHSSTECFIPSFPRTHILVAAKSSPVASQKIILTHLFSFKTLPWRSFLHLAALTTSHFHVFLLWLPLLHTSRINTVLLAPGFFHGLPPIWTSPLLLPSTSTLPWHLFPELVCLKTKQTCFLWHQHAEKRHAHCWKTLWSFPKPFPLLQCQRQAPHLFLEGQKNHSRPCECH